MPQGSHLAPLLFNIFINGINKCFITCLFLLFADDLKLSCIIKSPDGCGKLQNDLNNLVDWCEINGMESNPTKCKIITFKNTIDSDYMIDCHFLERTSI